MIFSIQQLEIKLKAIEVLIENELYEEVYYKYVQLDNAIKETKCTISGINSDDRESVANFYASYAYFLFSALEYDKFFEMYIMAQNYGYSYEKRRNFLYAAFIEPNLEDFRMNYEKNIDHMISEGCIRKALLFEELPYWLITTGNENEYYLYEKKSDLIKGKICFDIYESSFKKELNLNSSEDDYLVINNDSWDEVQTYIKGFGLKSKKKYIVDSNKRKFLSFLQSGTICESHLSKLVIFDNKDSLKEYFMSSSAYLPRQVIGSDEECIEYKKVIEEIHQFRLNKKNRFGDSILISICIPSYNRGKRAYENVIHTLQSNLDEEIEVVLSNNGTQNESRNYYDEIRKIEDSRLVYFEFDENQGAALNFCKVAEIAKGKYVLLISDEDLVDLEKLRCIVNILKCEDNNIAVIRTKTDKQGIVPFIGMTEKGKVSLDKFMLTSNYVSGIMFNKKLLERFNLLEYIKSNLDNETCLNYPHMVWEIVLCQYGKVLGLDIILVIEGKAEKTETKVTQIGENMSKAIPYYATLEGRLRQHRGFFDVIKEMKISKSDFDVFRELYRRLCGKTLFLVSLSINVFYKETDTDTDELMQSAYNKSVKLLDEMYYGKKNRNKYKYMEDLAEIKKCYQNSKSQC